MAELVRKYAPDPRISRLCHVLPRHHVPLIRGGAALMEWRLPAGLVPRGTRVWLKRDDGLAGAVEASGNKVRKLEFLFADALARGYNAVVTVGGTQSNHVRATAAIAAQLRMKAYAVVREDRGEPTRASTVAGNLLLTRVLGAQVFAVSRAEYREHGNRALMDILAARVRSEDTRPYIIPVGGSNALSSVGYAAAALEIDEQRARMRLPEFDAVYVAAGTGGTATGLAIGAQAMGKRTAVMGVCVCDQPSYFESQARSIYEGMGITGAKPAENLSFLDGYQGKGYAKTTDAELDLLLAISRSTGVVLDPTYTLKAVRGMLNHLQNAPVVPRHVCFVHTGGQLSLDDKTDEFCARLAAHEGRTCEAAGIQRLFAGSH